MLIGTIGEFESKCNTGLAPSSGLQDLSGYPIVVDPKHFFAVFHAFTRGSTDLCLPFVKNVKKVKIGPTYYR
jgi:hypothetical protein